MYTFERDQRCAKHIIEGSSIQSRAQLTSYQRCDRRRLTISNQKDLEAKSELRELPGEVLRRQENAIAILILYQLASGH